MAQASHLQHVFWPQHPCPVNRPFLSTWSYQVARSQGRAFSSAAQDTALSPGSMNSLNGILAFG